MKKQTVLLLVLLVAGLCFGLVFFLYGMPDGSLMTLFMSPEQIQQQTSKSLADKAIQGDADAQFHLGREHEKKALAAEKNNADGTADYAEALKWYNKSAEQGNNNARNNLGVMYINGEGVAKDEQKAIDYFKLSGDVGRQNLGATYRNIGMRYYNGMGVTKDIPQAIVWLQASADTGYKEADDFLAAMYVKGEYTPANIQDGFKWFFQRADKGDTDADMKLSALYFSDAQKNGGGASPAWAEGVNWLSKGADAGNLKAQYALGEIYLSNFGGPKNVIKGLEQLVKAADKGNKEAKQALQQAVMSAGRPAASAMPSAEYTVAVGYLNGTGVQQSNDEFVNWTRKAAEDWGYPDAELVLGDLYARGVGATQTDYVQSYKWMKLGFSQGQPSDQAFASQAQKEFDAIKSKMTPEQIAQADELARAFAPKNPQ